jgi:hypothetical protein
MDPKKRAGILWAIGGVAVIALIIWLLTSCAVLGGGPGTPGPGPVWLDLSLGGGTPPPVFGVWDPVKRRAIVCTSLSGPIRLRDPDSGVVLLSRDLEAGKVWIVWHKPDVNEVLKPGDPLPALFEGLFRSEELVTTNGVVTYPPWGLTFLEPTP